MKKFILFMLSALTLTGCSGQDSDYYPYNMKGLGVWVSNNDNDSSLYAGFVDGNYFNREEAAAACGSLAYSFAKSNHIENFGYVCCTVTSDSDCATKVR